MSKTLFTITLAVVFVLGGTVPARADEGRGRTLGVIPAVLTAQQKADNDKKVALARQRQSGQGESIQSDSGNAYGNLYKEPQATYAINWCGAGTAAALVTSWQIKTWGYDTVGQYSRYSNPDGAGYRWFYGGDAYLQHLAYDQDAVQDSITIPGPPISEPSANSGRDYSDETHVANAANNETVSLRTGGFYYAVWQGLSNLANFDTVLRDDIGTFQVQFSAVARACPTSSTCLPGWTGAPLSMNHWVSVGSFDIPNNQIMYGDSASTSQAYGGDPWWFHYFARSTFFNTHMLPYMSGAVVW